MYSNIDKDMPKMHFDKDFAYLETQKTRLVYRKQSEIHLVGEKTVSMP